MSTYTYNFNPIGTTFPNGLNVTQLYQEIQNDDSITVPIVTVVARNDNVEVVFDEELPNGTQVLALGDVVNAHVPAPYIAKQIFAVNINTEEIDDTIFTNIAKLNISNNIIRNATHIKVLSSLDNGAHTYTVRLYDKTNNNEIGQSTFSNTEEELVDITPLSNIPNNDFIMEVHVKVSDAGANASLYSIYIYYDD